MTSIGARHYRFGLLKVVVPVWVVKERGQSVSRRKTQGNERKIFGVSGHVIKAAIFGFFALVAKGSPTRSGEHVVIGDRNSPSLGASA